MGNLPASSDKRWPDVSEWAPPEDPRTFVTCVKVFDDTPLQIVALNSLEDYEPKLVAAGFNLISEIYDVGPFAPSERVKVRAELLRHYS